MNIALTFARSRACSAASRTASRCTCRTRGHLAHLFLGMDRNRLRDSPRWAPTRPIPDVSDVLAALEVIDGLGQTPLRYVERGVAQPPQRSDQRPGDQRRDPDRGQHAERDHDDDGHGPCAGSRHELVGGALELGEETGLDGAQCYPGGFGAAVPGEWIDAERLAGRVAQQGGLQDADALIDVGASDGVVEALHLDGRGARLELSGRGLLLGNRAAQRVPGSGWESARGCADQQQRVLDFRLLLGSAEGGQAARRAHDRWLAHRAGDVASKRQQRVDDARVADDNARGRETSRHRRRPQGRQGIEARERRLVAIPDTGVQVGHGVRGTAQGVGCPIDPCGGEVEGRAVGPAVGGGVGRGHAALDLQLVDQACDRPGQPRARRHLLQRAPLIELAPDGQPGQHQHQHQGQRHHGDDLGPDAPVFWSPSGVAAIDGRVGAARRCSRRCSRPRTIPQPSGTARRRSPPNTRSTERRCSDVFVTDQRG